MSELLSAWKQEVDREIANGAAGVFAMKDNPEFTVGEVVVYDGRLWEICSWPSGWNVEERIVLGHVSGSRTLDVKRRTVQKASEEQSVRFRALASLLRLQPLVTFEIRPFQEWESLA